MFFLGYLLTCCLKYMRDDVLVRRYETTAVTGGNDQIRPSAVSS